MFHPETREWEVYYVWILHRRDFAGRRMWIHIYTIKWEKAKSKASGQSSGLVRSSPVNIGDRKAICTHRERKQFQCVFCSRASVSILMLGLILPSRQQRVNRVSIWFEKTINTHTLPARIAFKYLATPSIFPAEYGERRGKSVPYLSMPLTPPTRSSTRAVFFRYIWLNCVVNSPNLSFHNPLLLWPEFCHQTTTTGERKTLSGSPFFVALFF